MKTVFWMVSMLFFAGVFFLALLYYNLDMAILNIMPARQGNIVLMFFSILGVLKSLFEIHRS